MTVICLRDEGFNVFRVQKDTGSVTGHTEDTVTDSSKAWTTDEWQNHAVRFTLGNHSGRSYNIISNTATALTCTIPKGSAVSGENIGTGDGSTTAFNGTLADPVDPGTLSITDGVEIFTDNGDGTLTGDQTGTGTITYSTGAWTVIFNTAPTDGQAITADYTPVYNFNCDSGLANGDTFEIISPGEDLAENTTPPGSATLTDQDVSTVAVMNNEEFYLYLDTTGGATFAITALTGEGVTVSGAGWSTNEWIGSRIKFTDGYLSGHSFFISSNTDDDIYSEGINLDTAGAQVGDHFNITDTFFREVLNTTPPGSATLTDQPIIGTISIKDEGFCLYLDPTGGTTYTVTALVDGGVEDNTQSWTENRWVGYRIEFTSGALFGNAYIIAINSATVIHGQGVNFFDEGVMSDDTFKIVPYFFLLVQNTTPPGSATLTDQDIEILVQHYNEGFWFYFVLVEETWGAPPVFGVRHGRGLGLSIHPATRFGIFPKGEAARGLK